LFELTFLGTSAAAPSVHRGLTSQVVSFRDHRFLIDCGEGTQRQILISGIGFRRLNRILITHGHLDHILGLGGLISTFSRWEAIEHLEIWAGSWALERIHSLIYGVVLRGARPPVKIDLIPIETGTLLEDNNFRLSAFPVSHRGPGVFGFSFEELPRRPFLPERAEELQIPPGPLRKELVEGRNITLPDGGVITPDDVLGPMRRGTKLVHIGDCGKTDNLLEVCQNADGLVIEATYLSYEAELAHQFGHLTAQQAAELARVANVGHLYLTHISRRYRESEVLQEANAIFPHVTVARDFAKYEVRRMD
jgi:ribonuclease Z